MCAFTRKHTFSFLKIYCTHMRHTLKLLWLLPSILMLFLALLAALVKMETGPFVYKNVSDVPYTDAAIVLGAAVLDGGRLSAVLQDRADTAVSLYENKKVRVILVSGDNGSKEYNEVNPAREYLISKGVRSEDIFLDHAGFDTYSSMYRAREIFKVTTATIVTQSFHLPRALFIANKLGITAYGLEADRREYLPKNSLRELLANVKAYVDILFLRNPKYMGEPMPITGESEGTI